MRLGTFVFALLFFRPSLMAADKTEIDPQLLSDFYDLWKASEFGQHPNRTERAAWILQGDTGHIVLRWTTSGENSRELWHGPIPECTIAQAHTHPVKSDPRPSANDIELSRRVGVPLYTISSSGIWMVTPLGEIRQIADSKWY